MKLLAATVAALIALLFAAVCLALVSQRIYQGGHGMISGFEPWHLGVALVVLLAAFGAAFVSALRAST